MAVRYAVIVILVSFVSGLDLRVSVVSPIGDAPSPRENGCMSHFGDVAVLFGGRSGATVFDDTWLLVSSNNSWVRVNPPAPAPRFAAVCAALNREFVLVGGRNLSHVLDFSIVWSFDVDQRQWFTVVADRPELVARAWAAGGTVNGGVLITHGRGMRGYHSDAVMVRLEGGFANVTTIVGPSSGVFEYGRPAYVMAAASAAISDGLMVVGGCTVHGRCPSELSWFLNATAGKWRIAPSALAPQFGACMARVPGADILVLLGGQVVTRQTLNRANVTGVSFYRQSTRNWYQHVAKRDANVMTNRVGANLVALDNPLRFIMFGGRGTTGARQLVETTNMFTFDAREVVEQNVTRTVPYISVLDVHGLLMFGAFGVGFPTGLYIARVFRFFTQRHYWFTLHYGMQAFSFALTIFGSVAVVSTVGLGVWSHAHGVIGVILISVVCLQIVFTLPCVKPQVTAGRKRAVWEVAHRWMGRAIVMMGIVNCTLGMLLYVVPVWVMVCWSVYVSLFLLGAFSTNMYHLSLRWRSPTAYEAYDENSERLAKQGTFEHETSKVRYGLDWYPA